jgi:hypothetical protein
MRPADPASGEALDAGRDWHIERARAELDAAYRAAGARAAEIHLTLCSLHLEQAGWVRPSAAQREGDWMRRCRPLHRRALEGAAA